MAKDRSILDSVKEDVADLLLNLKKVNLRLHTDRSKWLKLEALGEGDVRAGDIILMHFRPSFVQELNLVKARVEAAGLRFALLEDYIAPDTVSAG
jgi:hypothetical protein